ncbi:MAG TPA: hypothetical protein VKF59_23025 [Candidatus Dormibacteraeota bacterium]|nr:hypothetical protein [Candidatus Dormibacteraeota bacterium]
MSSPATSGSRWSYVRAAIIVAGVVVAYHYSLWTLYRELSVGTLLAGLGLVPAVAVLLAVQRATTRTAGVDIEDRSVDFIVGLPLLLAALVMLLIGPVSLSTFFWLWRLDLLTLPVFVAGAVSLVFGVRILWRVRVPIAFLLLAWPLPYLVLPAGGLHRLGVGATGALGRLLALLPLEPAAQAGGGVLSLVTSHGRRLALEAAFADTGAGAVLGFLLVGCAVALLVRGAVPRRLLWLATGTVLAWTLNLVWTLVVLAAEVTWALPARPPDPAVMPVVWSCVAALAMVAALPCFGLRIHRPGPEGQPGRRGTRGLAVAGLAVVAVASGVGAAADNTLASFQLVARDLGAPQVNGIDQHDATIAGWSLTRTDSLDWTKRYFGPDSTWIRYTYRPAPGATSSSVSGPAAAVVMDVVTTSDLSSLRTYDIAASYRFYPYQLVATRSADLGGGVVGHGTVYRGRGGSPWTGVYWEWPVQTPQGERYQRVVLHLDDAAAAVPALAAPRGPGTLRSAQLRVNDALGFQARPVPGAAERTQDFLVGFAHLVVSADAGASDGSRSPAPTGRSR